MQDCVYNNYELVVAAAESLSCFFFAFGSNYRERERVRDSKLFLVSNQLHTAVATWAETKHYVYQPHYRVLKP